MKEEEKEKLKDIQLDKYFFEAKFTKNNDWEKLGYCFIAPEFYSKTIAPMILKSTIKGTMEFEEKGISKNPSIVFFNKNFSSFNPFDGSFTIIEVKFDGQWIKIDAVQSTFGVDWSDKYTSILGNSNQWSNQQYLNKCSFSDLLSNEQSNTVQSY